MSSCHVSFASKLLASSAKHPVVSSRLAMSSQLVWAGLGPEIDGGYAEYTLVKAKYAN